MKTRSSSNRDYVFVTAVRPWIRRVLAPEARAWFPFAVILGILAVIWYWLARQLALPAMMLRAVTIRFAGGDLAARVTDARLLKRRDEFADLAREFNRMASQMERLIIDRNRLVGDISHELGSPLARLQVAVALARKRLGADAQAPLDRIEQETVRLDNLSQEVLHLTRLESPGRHLLPVRVHLDEFIRGLVEDSDFEASAIGRRVLLGSAIPCDAEVYPDLLRSALENVIRNAIRYTADQTAVHVEMLARHATSSIDIVIRDHGPGVREECLPHLFEPFYRVEPARDRKSGGGVGLGLSIARRAVQMHGGTIQARNSPEGGLEIEITLTPAY